MKLIDRIEIVATDEVYPYHNNPKEHPRTQIGLIASSIKDFGFLVPIIIDEESGIVAGHGRYLAAKRLNMEEVPCIRVEHLNEAQIKAFRLADNKVAESEWSQEKLISELELVSEDFNIEKYGFELEVEDEGAIEKEFTEPEVEFTEELKEEHNYVVLYFDNEIDWLQAKTLLNIKTVKSLESKEGFEKKGVGRVINGAETIEKIKQELA